MLSCFSLLGPTVVCWWLFAEEDGSLLRKERKLEKLEKEISSSVLFFVAFSSLDWCQAK